MSTHPHLFSPLTLRGVTLANRVVVSPMQQYAAGPDGLPTAFHRQHYGRLSLGGAGTVITEALAVSPEGRVTSADLGLWSDDHVGALAAIAEEIDRFGATPATQLIHAGRKGSVSRPWQGYAPLTQANAAEGDPPWTTLAPSALPANPGWHVPEALTGDGIARLVDAYARATARAARAGFKVLDIHAAHGYLIHTFLSPLSNRRTDAWGGDFAGRVRLLLQVMEAVRSAWPSERPLLVRLSCVDDQPGGWTLDESVALSRLLVEAGVDVVDCSSGGLGERTTTRMIRRPEGYQVPYAARIRAEAQVPTMAVGLITTPAFADAVVRDGRADLVAIGREALSNPHWPLHAARELGQDPDFSLWPSSWGWWLDKRARAAAAAAEGGA
ncbi:NADH:flavin oxidoreductase/NADH oxidase [Chelatococcus reniformis]|uniref:Oxidoreductase n=1 Tax=Chelatococcus reniformis TaxID=1494448 RepID=A0A916TWH3_9HYPH|nr:NADH:flavin oxidoreductase/NADH oxidase [Chelatococcus reniformis]GGC46100.1 oxidoreductase [Chelatococcus reniformis]